MNVSRTSLNKKLKMIRVTFQLINTEMGGGCSKCFVALFSLVLNGMQISLVLNCMRTSWSRDIRDFRFGEEFLVELLLFVLNVVELKL